MVLDLLVLEEEIKQGRLTLNNFDNGRLILGKFNEGFLEFDPEIFSGYGPQGYCLFYGYNRKKQPTYFVNVINLPKAGGCCKWIDVQVHTQAREKKGGIEIRRISDKVKGFKQTARFSRKEWNLIKEYALPVKRARKLEKLLDEIQQYTNKAIAELANHLDTEHQKFPKTSITLTGESSRYELDEKNISLKMSAKVDKKKTNKALLKALLQNKLYKSKLLIKSLKQETIYEEVGHYLHAQYQPKGTGECFSLERFFRMAVEEAIGFYCAKFANNEHSVGNVILPFYGFTNNEKVEIETRFVDELMSLEIAVKEAEKLNKGKIYDECLKELHEYVTDDLNCWRLSHFLGAVLGEKLWEKKEKSLVRKLMTAQNTNYPAQFFKAKDRLNSLLDK